MTALLAIAKKIVGLYVDTEREHARAIATRIAADFRAGGFDVVDGPNAAHALPSKAVAFRCLASTRADWAF
jgi:hypothetical protein